MAWLGPLLALPLDEPWLDRVGVIETAQLVIKWRRRRPPRILWIEARQSSEPAQQAA
jgi:hypothetical protein